MATPQTVNLAQLPTALAAAVRPPADLTPLLRRVSVYLGSQAKAAFDRQADPATGKAWAPLSASTLRQRRKRGKGARILLDTGILRQSVTARPVPPSSVAVGTNVAYGGFHQQGTRRMPARPFLGLSREALQVIDDMAARFFAGQAGR